MIPSNDLLRPDNQEGGKVDVLWTADQEAYVRKHWKAGESATQIGRVLGRTRNSVCAKLDRMGLLKTRKKPPKKVRPQPQKFRGAFVMSAAPVPGDKRQLRGRAWKPLPGIEPVPLLDLRDRMCKWPVTEDSPFLFCGARTPEGKPYCEHHQHISVGRGTPSEREATRELRRAA